MRDSRATERAGVRLGGRVVYAAALPRGRQQGMRTVRGDIRPDELGPCDAHEHLFLTTPLQPGDEFADVALAIEEARLLAAAALPHWLNSQPTQTAQIPRRPCSQRP